MAQITLKNIVKEYGDGFKAVNDINLDIADGEFMIFVGPSGCGKSTTLRMVVGLEDITSGNLLIDGKTVNDLAPKDRNLAMVFQNYALYPHLTVRENIAFPLRLNRNKLPEQEIRRRVDQAAEMLELTEHLERKPANLSGGQRQRVAMGRAIVREADAFLFDEPLSNLDAKLRGQMRTEISRLQRRLGITTIYVTHDQEIALAISDRLAIMATDGSIEQVGTPWEIYDKSANETVFKFMGLANFIPVRYEQGQHLVGQGNQAILWNDLPQESGKFGCRPSDIILSKQGEGLHAKVVRASFLGAVMDYMLEIDGVTLRTEVPTNKALQQNLMFTEGESCYVNFHDLLWFPNKTDSARG